MHTMSTLLIPNAEYVLLILVVCVGILFLCCREWNPARRKAKSIPPIRSTEFLANWENYRQNDQPGCYIILIYKHYTRRRTAHKFKRYDDIYIGQSIHMYKRVYNHLTGHGNGDVYADVKNKRRVFIKFIPCTPEELNQYEKQYIQDFDATQSYNRTKGGSKYTPI